MEKGKRKKEQLSMKSIKEKIRKKKNLRKPDRNKTYVFKRAKV